MTDSTHNNSSPEAPEEMAESYPKPCLSFGMGHRVHGIQGLRSVNQGEDAHHVPCEIIDVGDDGWFTLVLLDTGERKRRWHHSVSALHARVGLRLRVHEGYWIVRKANGVSSPISIASTPNPCVFEEAKGPLHEQMETHGGFSVSGPVALRLIAESAETEKEES